MLARLIGFLAADAKAERRAAAEELVRLGREGGATVGYVRVALADADARRRWGAAYVLYRLGARDEEVFLAAVEALGAADRDVRWAAATMVVALASSDAERCRQLRAVVADGEPVACKMALYCLRDLGGENDRTFVDALTKSDPAVRLAAVAGLARAPALSESGVDALLAVVQNDRESGVRRAAAVALGRAKSHGARVRPVLERLRAHSSDEDLARAARRALAGLNACGEGE